MYQGPAKNFNKISDFMDRWYADGKSRPASEYRAELRKAARIAYRVAKKTVKQQQRDSRT
jgi:hypothetical protein